MSESNPARTNLTSTDPPIASNALRRIQRQSQIAVEDSQLVEEHGYLGEEIRLDQNLYVNRTVEREIFANLDREMTSRAPSVLVVGEAGYGKTSLLWRVFHVLRARANWEPWLVKATLFSLDPSETRQDVRNTGIVWSDEVIAATEVTINQGRYPVVLLDTVDVLLHNEPDRQALLEFLLTLVEIGARVVATCRPDEAKLLGFFKHPSVTLGQYEAQELNDAIERHIDRYYSDVDLRTRSEHQKHITELVASGFPLREVCTNPLTLRMLFSLYAPIEPPSEVNVFDLYKKYWNQRVVSDTRAGTPEAAGSSLNLEAITHFSSLTMLAEGKPELSEGTLVNGIRTLQGPLSELEDIVRRGVIHRQGTGTIAFFHQTFFEHSAARAMLTRYGAAGMVLLDRRLEVRPNDLFLSPIVEQALLLAEEGIAPDANLADSLLLKLLNSNSLIAKNSAVYVYAHRRAVPQIVSTSLSQLLNNGQTAEIKRFLEVAPNVSTQRLPVLFVELDLIWNRSIWQEQSHVLDLLERLAVRDATRVQRFLEQHNVRKRVKEKGTSHQGGRRLLRVLLALASEFSEWSWREILELYRDALDLYANDLQALIIDSLCGMADLYGPSTIASRFFDETKSFDMREHFSVETTSAFGRLWARQWHESNLPIASILAETADAKPYFELRSKLRGTANILLAADNHAVLAALASFEQQEDNNLQWLWARMVLPPLLRGFARQDEGKITEAAVSRDEEESSVSVVRNWAARALGKWLARETQGDNGGSPEGTLGVKAREAISSARLPSDVLLQILSGDEFNDWQVWLDENLMGPLLADAFVAGHPSATMAVEQLIADPNRYETKLASSLNSKLAQRASQGRLEFAGKHFELAIKAGDERSAASLVRTLQLPALLDRSLTDRLSPEVEHLRERLTDSKSTTAQRTGYRFWIELIKRDLSTAPTLSELQELLRNVKDQIIQGLIVNLMVVSASKQQQDLEHVVRELLSIARESQSDFLRRESFNAVERLIVDNPRKLAGFATTTLDAALGTHVDAGIIGDFGPVIEALAQTETPVAYELFTRIVVSDVMAELGTQAKKNLQHYLRRPVRAVVGAVSSNTRKQILNLVGQMDGYIQQLVVEAICHEAFTEVASQLNDLLSDNAVWDGTKEVIRRQKYMRERTRGGSTWPELYAISSGAALMENNMSDEDIHAKTSLRSLSQPSLSGTLTGRLNDLADNVTKDLTLLKLYEDELRLEDDPRRRARYQREINQLRTSSSQYEREYESLERYLEGRPSETLSGERSELQEIHVKLDALLTGQSNLNMNLYQLRQAILSRYEAGERLIINSITERLDQAQADTVQTMLDAIELDRVDEAEMAEVMGALIRALAENKQRGVALPELGKVDEVISAPHLDLKHKLKFSIPIIPLLLNYEGEVEIGSRLNLEAAWDRLVGKFRRK